MDLTSQAKEQKAKINKWDPIKFQSFCTAKKTINKIKGQLTEWEKIFSIDMSDKWLIPKLHKELIKLKMKKKRRTSPVVQWLRLHTFNAGDKYLIPGWGTKIPYTMWCN